MKFFLDTEFVEDGKTINLISIGIVWEGGEYYAVSTEFDRTKANEWVKENVFPHLPDPTKQPELYKSRAEIAEDIRRIVSVESKLKPEFYGYYADYDWVAFCQLFGRMIDLPRGFPMYCRDIKQIADLLGAELPKQTSTEHDALNDARWNMLAFKHLYNEYGYREAPQKGSFSID
jgi:hypothetical protein